MDEHDKTGEKTDLPPVEDLFIMTTRNLLELSKMLGFNRGQFIKTLGKCWDIDQERIAQELLDKKEEKKL